MSLSLPLLLLAAVAPQDTLVLPPVVSAMHWQASGEMQLRGTWALSLRAPDGREVWRAGTTAPLPPASTLKVVTSAYALSHLNPLEGMATRVEGRGALEQGTWVGPVRLVAAGDYTLQRRDGRHSLRALGQALRASGIRRIQGPLQVVSLQGDRPPATGYPATWSTRHRGQSYAPPIGMGILADGVPTVTLTAPRTAGGRPSASASVDDLAGLMDVRVTVVGPQRVKGKKRLVTPRASVRATWEQHRLVVRGTMGARQRVTLTPPGGTAAVWDALWYAALVDAGVRVDDGPAIDQGPWVPLATTRSQPIASLLRDINVRSYNLGAEQVWRYTEAVSSETREQWLTKIGWSPATRRVVDGSGLSDANRVTASSFSAWWAGMVASPIGDLLLATLPTGGEGTLRHVGALGADRVRAKTGTLGTASSLVGAWRDSTGGRWTFVLLYEGTATGEARHRMYRLVDQWTRHFQPLVGMSFEDSLKAVTASMGSGLWDRVWSAIPSAPTTP